MGITFNYVKLNKSFETLAASYLAFKSLIACEKSVIYGLQSVLNTKECDYSL